MTPAPPPLEQLLRRREEFKGFLTHRLGDGAAAEDLLQDSLVKALRRGGDVQDETKLVAWFYRLLRNALVDHVRSRSAARDRERAWTSESVLDTELERHACRCFEDLLVTLKPAQAELVRRVELAGESLGEAAARLGITPNNASVTLHRARRELRARLEAFCGDCSTQACLDCDCDDAPARATRQAGGRAS